MHEVSIAENLVDLIGDEARIHHFRRVKMVRVTLGALGHVEPQALLFCFEAASRGTAAEGATLLIEVTPGQGWCAGCGQMVALPERYAPCPGCGKHVDLTAGEELRLTELEVA